MKNLFIVLFASCLLYSCSEKVNNSLNGKIKLSPLQIEVKDTKDLKSFEGVINGQLEKFQIGKSLNGKTNHSLSTDKILNKEFINVLGYDVKGNATSYRQEVTTKTMGEQLVITFVYKGTGEMCTGVNCTNCIIKDGGGCDCKNDGENGQTTNCNHTITTNPPK